jgi:hypothetical protein
MQKCRRAPVWQWPSLLSLDAPFVALVWQDFLARCYPASLRLPGRITLGLTVWAIYLADRLLDIRQAPTATETARHSFYRRHQALARAALGCILLADLVVAVGWVRFVVLEHGLLVAFGILMYFAAFPLGRLGGVAWKKVVAGMLFTAGVFLVPASGIPAPGYRLIWPAASFCALCLVNLLLVENWERHHRTTRGWFWMAALFIVCLPGHSRWFHSIAVSAAGLAAFAVLDDRIPVDARCALADAVLLSPLLYR